MKTIEQLIEESLIERLSNNFQKKPLPNAQKLFEDEKFVNGYDGEPPIELPVQFCQTKRSREDGINMLDLGCGTGSQIEYSTWLEKWKAWSTGLDVSKLMLDKAAHKLRGGRNRWMHKKAVALVHANMNDPLKNDFYALLNRPDIQDRLMPKRAERFKETKYRKIAEVKEVFEGRKGNYFDIIISNFSFPSYTPPEDVDGIIKFFSEGLKTGGLWQMAYTFEYHDEEENESSFNHDPKAIKKCMETYNMKLINDQSLSCSCCGIIYAKQIYMSSN
jgi:SAM-dependent methyltransferase